MPGYMVYNVQSDSNVTHTESGVDMVWEGRREAQRHAYSLNLEYGLRYPDWPTERRTWKVREATPEQLQAAKAVGAFGKDYASIIGTGQQSHIIRGA